MTMLLHRWQTIADTIPIAAQKASGGKTIWVFAMSEKPMRAEYYVEMVCTTHNEYK